MTISTLLFAQTSDDNWLITEDALGCIILCQNVNDADDFVVADSSFNGDGFMYYGKYIDCNNSKILADISLSDSITVEGLNTRSGKFATSKNISVGSTLMDLVNSNKDIQITAVMSEYDDLYLFENFKNSRIEYRLSSAVSKVLSGYTIDDREVRLLNFEGIEAKINAAGNAITVEQISVVLTGMCKN
ncbi:hypothetical protein [Fulvivirga ligni]|uniref:hypothetical protein n=1 Tax=Fulvivirga ligni TaxID=2904246 RepID=UPI001F47C589|nr:hypothetical protein [Fulvivirga ligni]UII22499.1 hypothetical protein LVD16_04560 [Fulvivirga ligni]